MRVSIVCIAIFCLSHVNGAPTDEGGKTSFKNYNFDNGDVINSLLPFWKDEAVFAVCQGNNDVKKCKVYLESTNQDKNTLQSCDLNLTYSGRLIDNMVRLYNAGNSKAVFLTGEGDDKIKLISINFKGCQIKETSLEIVKRNSQSPPLSFTFSHILPHEKNYELFFPDGKLCTGGLCKVTYDYEGNLVKAASKLPAVAEDFDQIAYANNTYIIVKSENGSANLYLVKDGEDQGNVPPVITIENRKFFTGLSVDENKITICGHGDGKVLCKQIHVEGEPRTINIELPFNYQKNYLNHIDVLNLENGFLQLLTGVNNLITVTHIDEAGKQGKTVQVDPKCNKDYPLLTKLYKNTEGQYCVKSFCMTSLDTGDRSRFSISNTCFLKTELI